MASQFRSSNRVLGILGAGRKTGHGMGIVFLFVVAIGLKDGRNSCATFGLMRTAT